MPRHPHDIVPRDDKDEILVAIYDVLVDIRNALAPAAKEPLESALADGVVTQEEASDAAAVLTTHKHQTEPKKKPAAKKAPAKKPAARKKPA